MADLSVQDKLYEGPRIALSLLTSDDVQDWLRYKQLNRAFFQPFEPVRSDDQFTLEAIRQFVETAHSNANRDLGYTFAIRLQDSRELIGHLTLSGVSRGPFQNALLGYAIAENHNGRGLMTEAVGLTVKVAFTDLGLHRIQAAVMPRNLGSIRVLEKNGFVQEGFSRNYLKINGHWEDHNLYAILNEDM